MSENDKKRRSKWDNDENQISTQISEHNAWQEKESYPGHLGHDSKPYDPKTDDVMHCRDFSERIIRGRLLECEAREMPTEILMIFHEAEGLVMWQKAILYLLVTMDLVSKIISVPLKNLGLSMQKKQEHGQG